MLTDFQEMTPAALFLFCHQDDEFAVYQQILLERASGRQVLCAFLTSGVPAGANPALRNAESLAVLGRLGIPHQNVMFVGSLLAIADGHLLEHLPAAASWLRKRLASLAGDVKIYVPAWEGGHPDHDALHFLGVEVSASIKLLPKVQQFSLYNAKCCPWKFFRILSPLPENGYIKVSRIPWSNRIHFLGYALSYVSQWRSWIGLFPFFALHLLFCGKQELQRVDRERLRRQPHAGLLYYERRGFSSWACLQERTQVWLEAYSAGLNVTVFGGEGDK